MRRRAPLLAAGLALVLLGGIGGWLARGLSLSPKPPGPVPLPQGYGIAVGFDAGTADLDRFGPVWYYDYAFRRPDAAPTHPHLLLISARSEATAAEIQRLARTRPGHWWILGNEPNDANQDNLSPAAYAQWFVRTAALIRAADSTAGIQSAGIADADPTWANNFYQATVAWSGAPPDLDAWNIHNYLLDGPDPYDVSRFTARITAFRRWMDSVGQAGTPLVLGEWGILYGRGCCNRPTDPESRGVAYLDATADWLETSGQVQAWAWFTLRSGALQFNGDLLQPDSSLLTGFGERLRARIAAYQPGATPTVRR